MTARYTVRPKADADLDRQAFYYVREGSPDLGRRFLLAAHTAFVLLAKFPSIGWAPQFPHPLLPTLRVWRVRRFERILILFVPAAEGVDILRVIHSARDLSALIKREGLQ